MKLSVRGVRRGSRRLAAHSILSWHLLFRHVFHRFLELFGTLLGGDRLDLHVVLQFVHAFHDNAVAYTEAFRYNVVLSIVLRHDFDLRGVDFVVLVHEIDKLLVLNFDRALLLYENSVALIHRKLTCPVVPERESDAGCRM